MISIIIPVYKAEQTLSKCINSVLVQTYTDFELILVDDGSPDNSGVICDQWAIRDERIRVIHQENRGVSHARNQGMKTALGDYICFVDSDDWIKPDYLKRMYDSLLDNKKSGLIVHGFECFTSEGIVLPGRKLDNKLLLSKDFGEAFREDHICRLGYSCSKLYKRDLIFQYNIFFDEQIYCCEDLMFMYAYLLHCDYLLYGDSQEYVYIKYSNSMSIVVNSFESEYKCFTLYKKYVELYMEKYSLSADSMKSSYDSMMVIFRRALKTNYLRLGIIGRSERLMNLKTLMKDNFEIIERYYNPVYRLDKIGNWLLMHKWLKIFDLYMFFLYTIKVKQIFLNSDSLIKMLFFC